MALRIPAADLHLGEAAHLALQAQRLHVVIVRRVGHYRRDFSSAVHSLQTYKPSTSGWTSIRTSETYEGVKKEAGAPQILLKMANWTGDFFVFMRREWNHRLQFVHVSVSAGLATQIQ